MIASAPRVRFAPAPTGYLHIGGARTALFNWIYARQTGGEMVLRVEDTDAERSQPHLIDAIYESLQWLGIDWDGEPVHQSDRIDMYKRAAARLLDEGRAYYCDCTQEAVQQRAKERGGPPGYDGFCRDRDVQPGQGVVVRFRTPDDGETGFDDLVRGHVSFENRNLEDFVIVRSSGQPMFVVANAVDDADLGITHVIRGEDLISVTPKVLLLREALGTEYHPTFAHLPLIVNEQRKKLSKRRDDVAVADYRDRGYLPEAMSNYLALLGWGPPDEVEIRPMAEILELFRLEDVTKAPAFFDLKKLDNINGEYIRTMDPDDFEARSRPFVEAQGWGERGDEALSALRPLVQERVKRLDDVPSYIDFLASDDLTFDEKSWRKVMENFDGATPILDDALETYPGLDWTNEALYEATKALGERHGYKLGKTTGPIRVAVTGKSVGPPLFECLEFLGRDATLERIRSARARL